MFRYQNHQKAHTPFSGSPTNSYIEIFKILYYTKKPTNFSIWRWKKQPLNDPVRLTPTQHSKIDFLPNQREILEVFFIAVQSSNQIWVLRSSWFIFIRFFLFSSLIKRFSSSLHIIISIALFFVSVFWLSS